jgi:MSHA biogenesis protein MshP
MRHRARQRGMSLVVAIFLITVVASLSAFAVTLGTASSEGANLQLQADRALAAARAGAEWGAYRAVVNNSCAASTSFNLNQAALRGFRVTVTCTARSVAPTLVYDIDSFAQVNNFGNAGYASRRVVTRVW